MTLDEKAGETQAEWTGSRSGSGTGGPLIYGVDWSTATATWSTRPCSRTTSGSDGDPRPQPGPAGLVDDSFAALSGLTG